MDPHDEYEIGIEMQLHGALDAAGAARIVAHLSGCERCRNFLEAARKTEAAMNVMGAAAVSQVDWAKHEQRLPAQMRAVLVLFALDGMPHKEIADVLGVPEGTVWSRLHQARKRLVTELQLQANPS